MILDPQMGNTYNGDAINNCLKIRMHGCPILPYISIIYTLLDRLLLCCLTRLPVPVSLHDYSQLDLDYCTYVQCIHISHTTYK